MSDDLFELYTEVTTPSQLRILRWAGEETICGAFRLAVTAAVPIAVGESVAQQLFGQRATFVAHGVAPLVRRGVIEMVSIGGSDDPEAAELSIAIVPRLDLMRLRTTSRVFQNVSAVDVLETLAKEWQLPHEKRLSASYGKRRYVTQYRESDLDFLRRVASRDGIGFFLEHAELANGEEKKPGDEKLVFYDNEQAYTALAPGEDRAAGNRLVHDRLGFEAHEHHVAGFRLERRIAHEHVRLGDFDFQKPRLELRAAAAVPPKARSPINTSLGGERLSIYLHGDRAALDLEGGKTEISDAVAAVRLEQAQREASVGRGRSRCMRLSPGSTFVLDEHPEASTLNQPYVVTRVEHRGETPEAARGASVTQNYENSFECVPASVVYRSALPKLDLRQVTETATVIGPEGKDIFVDELGRVQVRFHWDAESSAEETAWLRVLTTWAGTNWGSQFIPRVGMEVLVGFLSGDVDQPIVLGSVYNGTHPTPFALPGEAAKAGFKTESTPVGGAGSEITFDDTKGKERALFRSGRDLAQVVANDFDLEIGRAERVNVEGASARKVQGDASTTVLGGASETIGKDLNQSVGGSYVLAVKGDLDMRVTGNRNEKVEGRDRIEHVQPIERVMRDDATTRVLGHHVTIVGEHDARRSSTLHVEGSSHAYASGAHETVSDKEIVWRCGKNFVRLTPDALEFVVEKVRFVGKEVAVDADEKIELFSKKNIALLGKDIDVLADEKAVLRGQMARLELASEAHLEGAQINLMGPPDANAPATRDYERPKPTTFELLDASGNPLARKRFVLHFADGSERTGVTGDDGKTTVHIEDACEITFPDVDGARPG